MSDSLLELRDEFVYMKLFKDVLRVDVDMLLPGSVIKFTWFDYVGGGEGRGGRGAGGGRAGGSERARGRRNGTTKGPSEAVEGTGGRMGGEGSGCRAGGVPATN